MLLQKIAPLQKWAKDILLLVIRLWIANIFIRSGLLKLAPWDLSLIHIQMCIRDSSCAGMAKKDGDAKEWVSVPAGTCAKLVNGKVVG